MGINLTEYNEVKPTATQERFTTGAKRGSGEGKGRYDLLPAHAIHRLAQHYENGAKLYGDENYLKGMPLRQFISRALRHTFKFLEGQRDEDHATAAIWNLVALIETQELIRRGVLPKELDDLPDWTAPDFVTLLERGAWAAPGEGKVLPLVRDMDKCGTTDGVAPLPDVFYRDTHGWDITNFWIVRGNEVRYGKSFDEGSPSRVYSNLTAFEDAVADGTLYMVPDRLAEFDAAQTGGK